MTFTNLIRPLMAGMLHALEPDHVTAVSVLAAENATNNKKVSFPVVLKASQWALGHSLTLLLFGGIALVFKSSLSIFVTDISFYAEIVVGPIMVWLGIVAIRRNHKINQKMQIHKKIEAHDHLDSSLMHLHGTKGEEIAMNPMNRSFWVGMLHGVAGTGGALTSALVISSKTVGQSLLVLGIESVGIIIAMGLYSYSLMRVMSRFIERNLRIFKWFNAVAGVGSIVVGLIWMYYAIQ